jgi:hypothetical protein
MLGKIRNAYKISTGKSEVKRLFGTPDDSDIKMQLP